MYPISLWKTLTQDDAASTFKRLLNSRHVVDLQLIFWTSCGLMIVGSGFVLIFDHYCPESSIIDNKTLITAIAGAGCGVLTWCYMTGSSRLGVVDLFGCEITTLCKVITISETVPNLIKIYNNPPAQSIKFCSEEEYSPIFNNNSKDLESLEARVVRPVTEFYTYQKTVRDYFRRLSNIDKPNGDIQNWQNCIGNVIYMVFLMLESARNSVVSLVEFEPEQAESEIVILLSELIAYGFLVKHYENSSSYQPDARLERLKLRQFEYPGIVRAVHALAVANQSKRGKDEEAWRRVGALLEELNRRYFDAFGQSIAPTPSAPERVSAAWDLAGSAARHDGVGAAGSDHPALV
jgi:hypothetical protein